MLHRVSKKFANSRIRLVKTDKWQYDNNIVLMMWLNSLPDKCALVVLPVMWYYI